jgi:uncharacterized protein (DUF58 family)
MLAKELLAQVRRIEIKTRRLADDLVSGQYNSVFRGRGVSFEDVREYQVGDDVRTIDWNVSARYQAPYVKRYIEERELTVLSLVDVSGSSAFGTRQRQKIELAAEVAALLSFTAAKSNDKAGLIAFSDRVERYIPAKRSRQHVLALVASLLDLRPEGRGTKLSTALEFTLRVQKRRAVVFVLSDFFGEGFERALAAASQRHDLIPVVLSDPWERSLPDVGLCAFRDPETGREFLLDTSDRSVRKAFESAQREAEEARGKLFQKLGLESITVSTERPYIAEIAAFLRRRGRSGRR